MWGMTQTGQTYMYDAFESLQLSEYALTQSCDSYWIGFGLLQSEHANTER